MNHHFFAERLKYADHFTDWIDNWRFTRFVTLQFNDWRNRRLPDVGRSEHIRRVLREWDARVNRALLGKYWATHPDRTFAFFVPEKVELSPHWHGLVRFSDDLGWRGKLETKFDSVAGKLWLNLVPGGTCDVQVVDGQTPVTKYVAKTLPYTLSYQHFVAPDELVRG